jgi:NADH dehydrogenase FAD-containing subunit
VLALGDMVRVRTADGEAHAFAGIARVAMQYGRYAARAARLPAGLRHDVQRAA